MRGMMVWRRKTSLKQFPMHGPCYPLEINFLYMTFETELKLIYQVPVINDKICINMKA